MVQNSCVPDWKVSLPQGERYLPVYLLLDTSGSMAAGNAIAAVRQGLEAFAKEMAADEQTRQLVRLGVIAFNTEAQSLTQGLVRFDDWKVPDLTASGTTQLDRALDEVRQSIAQYVRKPVKGGNKGDWKPYIFIFTDAKPSDETWKAAKDRLFDPSLGHVIPNAIITAGCGPEVEDATLKAISTGPAFRVDSTEAAFLAFFQFVSASTLRSLQQSQRANQSADPTAGLAVSQHIHRIP
jgi:uncharacterized protein YegL